MLAVAFAQPIFAQSPAPCGVTGILTDPGNSAQAAVNPEYPTRTNTFNWYYGQQNNGRWYNLNSQALPNTNAIWLPWEQSDNSLMTHIIGKRDLAKDGWELIKRNLGFDDSGVRVPNLINPYIVLYNKYSGMLRVFVAIGERRNDYQFADIKLLFNTNGSQKKAGTLNRLEGIGTALENTSAGRDGREFSAVARFLNQDTKWFMADFPMEYDPCACQFDSKLVVEVRLISSADIKLKGLTTGTLVSTSTAPGATTSTSSDFDNAVNMFKKVNGVITAGQSTHKTLSGYTSFINGKLTAQGTKTSVPDANAKKAAFSQLTSALGSSSFLKAGLSAVPYIGTAVSLLDSFFGGGKEESGPQAVSMQPMSIEMTTTMTGTMNATALYETITFNNPGTKAITTPEEYPYYNEAMGVFSLIKKPIVEVHSVGTTDGTYFGRNTEYYIPEELQYVVNPASGLEVQDFQVALVQEGNKFPTTMPGGSGWEYEGIVSKGDGTTRHAIRTPYVDSGCLTNQSFTLEVSDIKNQFNATGAPIYLKLILNMRRLNATPTTQNVLIVLKYPVTVRTVSEIVVDYTRPCVPVQPQMDATTLQNFCTSTTYTSAMNLRTSGPASAGAAVTNPAAVADVQIYPNPATDAATIRFSGAAAGRASAYLTDMFGNRVLTVMQNEIVEAGEQQRTFNTTVLKPGLYQCVIETPDGKRVSTRFSVTR